MWQCHYCKTLLSSDVQKKNRLCPTCGSDLHACKNCTHFDENLSSKCIETNSPWVADRSTQNNCTFFEFQTVKPTPSNENKETLTEAERAKRAFKALFRNA